MFRFLFFGLLLHLYLFHCTDGQLEEYFRWKQITFAAVEKGGDDILFPETLSTTGTSNATNLSSNSYYVPGNNIPMGATHYNGHLIVTVPRRRVGIPSTLNYISTKSTKGSSPSFRAFPDQKTNDLHPTLQPDPNRIVSVYRTRVDECNRLWFIDTGLLEYPNNATQVQRPSIWIYDLERNSLIRRFEIPQRIVERGSGLASITVDVQQSNCNNAYGYIPDLAAYRFYVYSFAQNRIWSFNHNYFHFDPLQGDFNVAGLQYQWDDGIFSITLGNRNQDGYRLAYFHPMVSTSEFAVSTRVLQTESFANRSNHGSDFMYLGTRGAFTQSAMHDYDRNSGIVFYSQVAINGISCWNSAKPYIPANHVILAQNNVTMIYPGDLNVDRDGNLWVFTNSMPRFIYGRLDQNEYNFRIWRASAAEIVAGTACANNIQSNYNNNNLNNNFNNNNPNNNFNSNPNPNYNLNSKPNNNLNFNSAIINPSNNFNSATINPNTNLNGNSNNIFNNNGNINTVSNVNPNYNRNQNNNGLF